MGSVLAFPACRASSVPRKPPHEPREKALAAKIIILPVVRVSRTPEGEPSGRRRPPKSG